MENPYQAWRRDRLILQRLNAVLVVRNHSWGYAHYLQTFSRISSLCSGMVQRSQDIQS